MVAGHKVVWPKLSQRRFLLAADVCRVWAPRMKTASSGRVYRAGNVPGQDDAVDVPVWVGNGDGGKEGDGVGVEGLREEFVGWGVLEDFAEVHNSDVLADLSD